MGLTRWGSRGSAISGTVEAKRGSKGCPQASTFWLMIEKVACTIIFGIEHVNARGRRGRWSTFWFHKNYRQSELARALSNSLPSTHTHPNPRTESQQLAAWPMLEQSISLWFFLHLVFLTATTQFSVNSLRKKKKSKKAGLIYCPGSLETSSEESLEDEFYFK